MSLPRMLYWNLLSELERQTRVILVPEFETPQDIWGFQMDLVEFQKHMRKLIASKRAEKQDLSAQIQTLVTASEQGWKDAVAKIQTSMAELDHIIAIYQHAMTLSKIIGDTFAYVMFGGTEQAIHPLSENAGTPGLPTDHGLLGVLGMAEALANAGVGFPVIHDITNILRIGDMTLINPTDESLTIEVKTRLISSENDVNELSVQLFGAFDQERWDAINTKLLTIYPKPEASVEDAPRRMRPSRQLNRQLERMAKALEQQTAIPGEVKRDEGNDTMMLTIQSQHSGWHWDILQEIVKEAKKSNYASRSVDGAILYAAIYRDEPILAPLVGVADTSFFTQLLEDLVNSDIFLPDRDQNALIVTGSSDHFLRRTPVTATPFLLYGLDLEDRIHLLWGRLILFVHINPGKVAIALESVGISTGLPDNGEDASANWMQMVYTFETPDGTVWSAELLQFLRIHNKLLYDYITLDTFLGMMGEITSSVTAAFEGELRRWVEQNTDPDEQI